MILVGISGITNGGKSTLSKMLMSHYKNAAYICQDTYFHAKDSGKLEHRPDLNAYNYDAFECVDSERFLGEVDSLISHEPSFDFIFVDGFLLFMYEFLLNKFDVKLFFTLTKEECFHRRVNRNYKWVGTVEYFEQLVWPNYIKYLEHCRARETSGILYLDGAAQMTDTYTFVQNKLDNIAKK